MRIGGKRGGHHGRPERIEFPYTVQQWRDDLLLRNRTVRHILSPPEQWLMDEEWIDTFLIPVGGL